MQEAVFFLDIDFFSYRIVNYSLNPKKIFEFVVFKTAQNAALFCSDLFVIVTGHCNVF